MNVQACLQYVALYVIQLMSVCKRRKAALAPAFSEGLFCWMLIGALVQGQPQHSCVRANEHQSRPFYNTDSLSFSL